ncbi:YhgE/Pip domain-containing protein [Lysinibacillus pakistanensis]|uniref:YhgE/Pip domain-containing protein n=1 Tax=Lysinibacillus pakistanensis TaxID=759811 RepID=A0AAX3WSY4_9BACI|nr:YhgE/Pip domain-containing protein [Lysinibacillus pakistanensis]MDM5230284.1 YhgE/Pip domain-containing protein [Lysinibacillus pakistanensis]WHY45870.1 YhgE/Pip domain-containing protein [Lysinibacillus pakistanensis]WHY50882.1 YhgE/Pip domain-containing protein [Lysinibacillus pakistanensis]
MIKAEWLKILKTRKMLVSIIAVLFIPVMYAGMFLWAFWDPYAGLPNLPVAIVNEDKGAEMDGEKLDLGDTLVEKLVDSEQFNFIEVSKEQAEKGLNGRDYYMILEIPTNFSDHATTLLDDKPSKLVMNYIPNEGLNFLGAQIGETAMDRVRAEVNAQVSATYAEKLFDSIATLGDGFTEAADGSNKLDEGAQKVANGAKDLKGYLEQLASSTIELSNGTDKITKGAGDAAKGANDLSTGLVKLQDGTVQLQKGAQQAANGATSLEQGLTQYTQGVAKVEAGLNTLNDKQQQISSGAASIAENAGALNGAANQLTSGSAKVEAGITALSNQLQGMMASMPEEQAAVLKQTLAELQAGSASVHNGLNSLSAGTEKLQAGANQVSSGATQIAAGQAEVLAGANTLTAKSNALVEGAKGLQAGNTTLAAKLGELNAGVKTAVTGSKTLASGLNELANGTTTLNQGTSTLASKSGELAQGSATLADGSTELADGTSTLSGKLGEASEKANEVHANKDTYDMVGSPVQVDKESVNHVPNYGTGFAPYFISLGLFVGALLISIVFPLVEPAIRPKNGAAWFTSKVSVLAFVGLIQTILTVVIVKWGLGLEVNNLGYFILTALLTSYVFLALIQMLVSIFGDPGRFIAIVVLILQLTTSAGTFPLELIPSPLQVFNKLLPMTYTVQAFKSSISTGDMTFLMQNYGVLLGFLVAFLAITFGYFMLLHTKRYSKVAEEN